MHATDNRVSAPLAAVVPMHVAAALLGLDKRAFAKRVRKGDVDGATPSFDITGYVMGWRDVAALLEAALSEDELRTALARLLAVRAGALRVVDGHFEAVVQRCSAPTDDLPDAALKTMVMLAYEEGCAHSPTAFDRWTSRSGHGLHHRDIMVRLLCSSWDSVLVLSDIAIRSSDNPPAPDLNDPLVALRAAAGTFGTGTGRELSVTKFNAWATEAGSVVRADEVRRRYGSWNEAKAAAGLEVNDHPSQQRL